jgi:hypothetical protein
METGQADRKWTPQMIQDMFRNNADFKMVKFIFGETGQRETIYLMYAEGLVEIRQINEFVLPRLEKMLTDGDNAPSLDKKLDLSLLHKPEDLVTHIYSGLLGLFFENKDAVYMLDISEMPIRKPEESNTEISIKGPRDGFVEDIVLNVALVRKRLKTTSLCYEQFHLGRRSKTRVALLYIEDIANPEIISKVRSRLQSIDMDMVTGTGQFEHLLADNKMSLFPTLDYTTRPDYAAECLIRGRFVVLTDGQPNGIIGPANLTLLLKSPEDQYFPYYFVWMGVILRIAGLLTSMLLPGFWIALAAFNMEQVPLPLLATMSVSRIGLPLPGPLEAFLMVGLFEMFREAGERLPKAVGQTVAVVGGIVIGDAIIRAGIASTTMLVVASLTAVASFTLVNQSLVGTVSVIRFFTMLCSSFLGMYGFILAVMGITMYMAKLQSFGVPFLAPLSPVSLKDVLAALFRQPHAQMHRRPAYIQPTDRSRRPEGDNQS